MRREIPSPDGRSGAERALAGDARPAGEPRRRRRPLLEDVQVAVPRPPRTAGPLRISTRPRPSSAAAARRRPAHPRRARPRQSTSWPPMRSSGAAYSSTTGWGASARATTRSCGCLALPPLLGPRADHLSRCAGPAARMSRVRKSHLRPGSRRAAPRRRAGPPRAPAPEGRPPSPRSATFCRRRGPRELEGDERIGDVDVDGPPRIPHGRRRPPIGGHGLQKPLAAAADLRAIEAVAARRADRGPAGDRRIRLIQVPLARGCVSRETLRSPLIGVPWRDDEEALGLVALAVRLHVPAVAQVFVHDPPLERGQRVELDRLARCSTASSAASSASARSASARRSR